MSNAVLAKCDALDGASDGLVQNTEACQAAFNLDRDVPTCTATRDGTCLSAAQKGAIGPLFAGAVTGAGTKIYSSFPFDAGLATAGRASWKFTNSLNLDTGAVGLIWQVNWVEQGQAPDSVIASARGAGNSGRVNADLPSTWSATRTRPLCAYPKIAKYKGSGSLEDAASFSCQ